jgi:hypothetical protein
MKIINAHYEGNAYISTVAIPTTKVEYGMLQKLKYNLISDKLEICNWHPEWLNLPLAIEYANALGHSQVIFNGTEDYMDVENDPQWGNYRVTATPSNLETLIAGYRLMGRHRKVAQILKKIKSLGIEDMVSNMVPGHQ